MSRAGPRALGKSGVWRMVGLPLCWDPKRRGRLRGMLRPMWDLVGVRSLRNFRGKVLWRSQAPRSEAQGRSQDWYREGN